MVKVFAIQDPSLPLKTYQDQLSEIKNRLVGASNVLPFHFSILTDKASLLIRQFVKDNLYDRIIGEFLICTRGPAILDKNFVENVNTQVSFQDMH